MRPHHTSVFANSHYHHMGTNNEVHPTWVTYQHAKDLHKVLPLLVSAFQTDPGFRYVFGNEQPEKEKGLQWTWERTLCALSEFRHCYLLRDEVDKEKLAVVVLWLPPGRKVGMIEQFKAGFLSFPFYFGISAFSRVLKFAEFSDKHKARLDKAGIKYWYLDTIAVDVSLQGKGLGKKSMQHFLDDAALMHEGGATLIALYTCNQRNVPFYKGLGFEVKFEEEIGTGEPNAVKVWWMEKALT